MMVVGIEHLLAIANGTIREGKMVINARGVVFGPVSTQHRDLRADGIRYADDYQGNALAAMLAPNRIELRFHKAFTDVQVVELIRRLTSEASLAFLAHWRVTYQGRDLSL